MPSYVIESFVAPFLASIWLFHQEASWLVREHQLALTHPCTEGRIPNDNKLPSCNPFRLSCDLLSVAVCSIVCQEHSQDHIYGSYHPLSLCLTVPSLWANAFADITATCKPIFFSTNKKTQRNLNNFCFVSSLQFLALAHSAFIFSLCPIWPLCGIFVNFSFSPSKRANGNWIGMTKWLYCKVYSVRQMLHQI